MYRLDVDWCRNLMADLIQKCQGTFDELVVQEFDEQFKMDGNVCEFFKNKKDDYEVLSSFIRKDDYEKFIIYCNFRSVENDVFLKFLNTINLRNKINFYLFITEKLINENYEVRRLKKINGDFGLETIIDDESYKRVQHIVKDMLQKYNIFKTFYNQELANKIFANVFEDNLNEINDFLSEIYPISH